jgi:hypothetical protein
MSDFGADPVPDTNKIRQVAFGYGLAPLPKLKVDQFSTAGANKVYTLVKKIGSTRLQVLVDPANIPG